jgi:translation initiation factor IF-1
VKPFWLNTRSVYVFESFDPETQLITARERVKGKVKTPSPSQQFKVNLDKSIKGHTICHINNTMIDISQLKKGDQVHLGIYKYPDSPQKYVSVIGMNYWFSRGPYMKALTANRHLLSFQDEGYSRGNSVWAVGDVESIDLETRTVTLKRRPPPREKMYGLRFIEEAGNKAHLWGRGKKNYKNLKVYFKEYEESPEVTLEIIVGALFFHNGNFIRHKKDSLGVIKKGDTICYLFFPREPSSGVSYTNDVRVCTPITIKDE